MQKKKGIATKKNYVQSGIPGHRAPGGRKPSPMRGVLRAVILLAGALIACVLIVMLISNLIAGSNKLVKLNAAPTDNIQPLGQNVLHYDGATLRCITPSGSTKWQYTVGGGADYVTNGSMIVLWTGYQLHVLDKNGTPTYVDRMDNPIRFARVGSSYVAACIGSETSSTLRVISHTGTLLESIAVDDLFLLDIGFFSSGEQTMWVMGLDIAGNAPITKLATYQPGRMSTGAVELNDQMAYRVYIHNNLMMVVDTSKIRPYNYKCVEQTDLSPVLVYGWRINQVRSIGKNTYALLEPMSASSGTTFSELRLVTNYTMESLRLLSPCFASALGEKGIYGFGTNIVYFAPYGSKSFKNAHLGYNVTDFICLLDGGYAVMALGDDVCIIKLPL